MSDQLTDGGHRADEQSPGSINHLLPEGSALGEHLADLPHFDVPWDRLAESDGWSVWLGHPPVPGAIEILPAPPELV